MPAFGAFSGCRIQASKGICNHRNNNSDAVLTGENWWCQAEGEGAGTASTRCFKNSVCDHAGTRGMSMSPRQTFLETTIRSKRKRRKRRRLTQYDKVTRSS